MTKTLDVEKLSEALNQQVKISYDTALSTEHIFISQILRRIAVAVESSLVEYSRPEYSRLDGQISLSDKIAIQDAVINNQEAEIEALKEKEAASEIVASSLRRHIEEQASTIAKQEADIERFRAAHATLWAVRYSGIPSDE